MANGERITTGPEIIILFRDEALDILAPIDEASDTIPDTDIELHHQLDDALGILPTRLLPTDQEKG
jgi:hypothetical protein